MQGMPAYSLLGTPPTSDARNNGLQSLLPLGREADFLAIRLDEAPLLKFGYRFVVGPVASAIALNYTADHLAAGELVVGREGEDGQGLVAQT